MLKGEQVKVIDEKGTSLPDCPSLLKALLAFTAAATNGPHHSLNMLVQLSASMRAQGHGGTLLVVPTGTEQLARIDCAADSLLDYAAVCSALGALASGSEKTKKTAGSGKARFGGRWIRLED